ncbi:hypothetical protein LCGC14_1269300 [marine sediment metagenome]|uniref:PD-(D/E)XK endonuclease-like domain-containing protein n=1 Tax=marine sediment metagenome TaxID=412755 RepID=A0A0F9LJL1_9ZZZZ|nr:hypothetical protein [bacterium]
MEIKSIVEKLSYSAVRSYCTSPALFWKHYVMKEHFVPSLTMLTGKAWHRGLEEYYRGNNDYVGIGVETLVKGYDEVLDATPREKTQDLGVKFKKEIELLKENLEAYPEMERNWEPSDIIERKIVMPSPVEGGLPISGIADILEKGGSPIDHKYVGRKNNGDMSKHMIQAWFYYHLVKHETGKYPAYFMISEFKKVKNRDGSPQLTERVLEYEDKWVKRIDQFFKEICEQILGQKHFLPNPFNIFQDDDWKSYLND